MMSDNANPFAPAAAKPRTSAARNALLWLLGAIVLALLGGLLALWLLGNQQRVQADSLRLGSGHP